MTALQGSCLCGGVRFEIDGPPMRIAIAGSVKKRNGHSVRGHGSPPPISAFSPARSLSRFYEFDAWHASRLLQSVSRAVLVKFDERLRSEQTDPRAVALNGVALATLDDDPGVRPDAHAFIIDKAPWFAVTDDLSQ